MTQPAERDPWQAPIIAKLTQVATAVSPRPAWAEALARLGPQPSDEERLAVYQAVRQSGAIPEEASFYLVAWQIDAITLDAAEVVLQPLEKQVEAIAHRLGWEEDQPCPPGAGPPEYAQAQKQLHDAWDALYAAALERFGETAMASLLRSNRERFEQLNEAGRQFFHGPRTAERVEDLAWLGDLHRDVTECLEADSPMGELGLRYGAADDFWEVAMYPMPVELVGGAHDGAVVAPGFSLDLERLRAAFDSVADFGWNALGVNDSEGPYVHIEGVYRGREIFLQILASAPAEEEPGLKFDTNRRTPRPE